MFPVGALAAVALCVPLLLADRQNVVADPTVDFSTIKTFSIGKGSAKTTRPELNNELIFKKVGTAIRKQLVAKGLTEAQDRPDVVVGFIVGSDRPNGPSVIFDQGTLAIDFTSRAGNSVWHGVYTDDGRTPASVAERLPRGVEKLLGEYPPKKK